jgi:aminoglycoside 2''-phosphotransferase
LLITSNLGDPEGLARIEEALASSFPDLEVGSIRVLETGFGSVVVQTSDNVIFRVARHAHAAEGHTKEANLLPVLASRLPVSVPQPQWRAEPGSPGLPLGAIGYRRLAGEPLTPTWLARHDADKVASEIAKFLIALHRFPVEQAVQLGVPPADVNGCSFEALRRRVMSVLHDVLTPEEYDTVSRWSDGFLADPALQHFDAVLSHGDFWFGNVLVNDESESVVAVLDWTSAAIGDPAEDFARQLHLGETFASRVLRAYESRRGAVDPALIHRMKRRWELVEFAGVRTAIELDDPEELKETIGKLRAGPILTAQPQRR